jgi:antitoxin VapB
MALNIEDQEADRLARATGESLPDESGRGDADAVRRNIRMIQQRFVSGRGTDTRSPDEIIGYDEHGLPA